MRCTSKVAFITDPLIWIDLQLLQVYVALNFQGYGVRLIDEMIVSLKLAVAQVQGCPICKDFVKCWQINEWHKWRHGIDWFILAPWGVRGAIFKDPQSGVSPPFELQQTKLWCDLVNC